MARDLSSRTVLASPNQASTVFGITGSNPVRHKSLFVMRFLRDVGQGGEEWKDGLTFVVKSVDRPSVQPQVEEINQYNRKRLIQTGVKYNPINCVLFDTADSAAMSMWVQYARYYFGDYAQTPASYSDDVVAARMLDPGKQGYGYHIRPTSSTTPSGLNTQFFFKKVEIMQVWGNQFTAFEIINPKITAWNPDDLDYENTGIATISLSLSFEAIYHLNDGKPVNIAQNATLVEAFAGAFNGHVIEPTNNTRTNSFTRQADDTEDYSDLTNSGLRKNSSYNSLISSIRNLLARKTKKYKTTFNDRGEQTISTGGSISKYGNFNFGNFESVAGGLPNEISAVSGFKSIDSIVNAIGSDAIDFADLPGSIAMAAQISGTTPGEQASKTNYGITPKFDNYPGGLPNNDFAGNPDDIQDSLRLSALATAAFNSRTDGTMQIGVVRPKPIFEIPTATYIPDEEADTIYDSLEINDVEHYDVTLINGATVQWSPPYLRDDQHDGPDYVAPTFAFGPVNAIVHLYAGVVGFSDHNISARVGTLNKTIYPVTIAAGKHGQNAAINTPINIASSAIGHVITFGTISDSIIVGSEIDGILTTVGTITGNTIVGSQIITVVETYGNADIQINLDKAISGIHAIAGMIEKDVTVSISSTAVHSTTASINSQIPITSTISGTYTTIGSINQSIVVSSSMTVEHSISGTINEEVPVAIAASGIAFIDIAGTIAKQIDVVSSISGYLSVGGEVAKEITITPSISGALGNTSDISASVTVYSIANGDFIIQGTVNKSITVSSNIQSTHSITGDANMQVPVSPAIDGLHSKAGPISSTVVVTPAISGAHGIVGSLDKEIIVTPSIAGERPPVTGTIGDSVIVTGSASGTFTSIGTIDDQIIVTLTAEGYTEATLSVFEQGHWDDSGTWSDDDLWNDS